MKIQELREKTSKELQEQMKEIEMELMKEQAQIAIGTVPKNPGKVGEMKRTRAKILTVLNQRGGVQQ
jgi:large subunit ribosomal protein L29